MKYRKGFVYQLAEDFTILTRISPDDIVLTDMLCLNPDGWLTVKAGYAWDGASGPTLNSDNSMTPSLVHDALSQLMRLELLSVGWVPVANKLFNQMLKDRGMWKVRRWYWMRGLALTGGSFADPKNKKPIFTVR